MTMRAISIALMCSILLPSAGYSQKWEWQMPYPQGNNLTGIRLTGNYSFIAAGNGGTILRGTNIAAPYDTVPVWEVVHLPGLPGNVGGMKFFDNCNGWCTDGASLYITLDGGQHWDRVEIPGSHSLRSLAFVDPIHGWVLADSTLFATIDGGRSWSPFPVPDSGYVTTLGAIFFLDARNGWAAGRDLYRTTNGGRSWETIHALFGDVIRKISFFDAGNGFFLVDHINGTADWSGLRQTTNGGATWTIPLLVYRSQYPLSDAPAQPIHFTDPLHGWFIPDATADGYIYTSAGDQLGNISMLRTTDGGEDWIGVTLPDSLATTVSDLDVSQYGDIVWAVGGNSILLSTNSGSNWRRVTRSPAQELGAIAMASATNGWAAGEKIFGTTDGGTRWTEQLERFGMRIHTIFALDQNTAWCAGEAGDAGPRASPASGLRSPAFDSQAGVLYLTTDGGADWAKAWEGTSPPVLNSVFFFDVRHGWAAGDGAVMKTDNGGLEWNGAALPRATSWRKILFTDSIHGWLAGDSGIVLRTDNGGAGWYPVTAFHASYTPEIFFLNTRVGWITTDSGLEHTSDGGQTWAFFGDTNPEPLITFPHPLRQVRFVNPAEGWGLSNYATVVRSLDSGKVWEFVPDPAAGSRQSLVSLTATDPATVWIAGGSTILHYPSTLPEPQPTTCIPPIIVCYPAGWNMVSKPGDADTLRPAFYSLIPFDSLRPGESTWKKFPRDTCFWYPGVNRDELVIYLGYRWNFIGGLPFTASVQNIFGMFTSAFWTYDNGYRHATTLEPGRAYWVKAGVIPEYITVSRMRTQ